MAPEVVVTASDMARLCERSFALRNASRNLRGLSHGTRLQTGEIRRLAQQAQARVTGIRRQSVIARKVRDGQLPRASVPIIIGGPGGGGAEPVTAATRP